MTRSQTRKSRTPTRSLRGLLHLERRVVELRAQHGWKFKKLALPVNILLKDGHKTILQIAGGVGDRVF